MAIYWGWVVVVSFVILYTMSMCVSTVTFTELIVPMSAESNADLSLLMMLGTLTTSLPLLAAPASNWLHYRYGTRPTVFTGVLVASIALIVMPFIPSVSLMLLFYGLLGGIGIMCIINTPFILVSEYFPYDHPRHVLATSILVTAYPLATLLGNPITYAVMSAVGWRATYFINGLIMFVVGIATCSTFRANTMTALNQEMGSSSVSDNLPIDNSSGDDDFKQFVQENGNENLQNLSEKLESENNINAVEKERPPGRIAAQNSPQIENNLKMNNFKKILSDESELLQLVPRISFIPKRTKIFLGAIWLIVSTTKAIGYNAPMFTLVKQMEFLGISQEQASLAMLVAGVCEVVSRVVTSYVGDRFKGHALYMYVAFSFVMCIQNAIGSLAYTYLHLVIYAAVLGIFAGPIIAAMYSSCAEVLDGENVPALFSLFRIALGVGGLVGPTIAGAIYDHTGSFTGVFYTTCGTYGVTSLLYGLIIVINRVRPPFFYPPQENDVSSAPSYSSLSSSKDEDDTFARLANRET